MPFVFPDGENKCVVLRHPRRPFAERLPLEVVIPVGYPVQGLYFLHASAYGGDFPAEYEMQFDDGTTETVKLISGVNMTGWVNASPELPRERGTRSVLAWTGSVPRFARVGVLRMEWVNPNPGKTLQAVRFHKQPTAVGMPILMGLTAALAPGTVGAGPTEADRDRAAALAAGATAALAAGDPARAEALARESLALDDRGEDAHATLADLADRSGTEDERLAVYQEWIDVGTTRARPYNALAEILEGRGNLRGALDAYRQSLRNEWNQPPIIEAVSRLEQRVK